MIKEIKNPDIKEILSAEDFKIKNNLKVYPDLTKIYICGDVLISLLESDCVINGEISGEAAVEIAEFLAFLSPRSVFCSINTAKQINLNGYEKNEVILFEKEQIIEKTDQPKEEAHIKSDKIYEIMEKGGFLLPPKDIFSVDFCYRLNRGALKYFANENEGAAISLVCDDVCFINGIVSLKKGNGSKILAEIIKKSQKEKIFALSKTQTAGFYLKNGFVEKGRKIYLIRSNSK